MVVVAVVVGVIISGVMIISLLTTITLSSNNYFSIMDFRDSVNVPESISTYRPLNVIL